MLRDVFLLKLDAPLAVSEKKHGATKHEVFFSKKNTLPKIISKFAPETRPKPNRKGSFQPSIFRGKHSLASFQGG